MKKIFISIALFIATNLLASKKVASKLETPPSTLEEALGRGYVVINHPKLKGGRTQHIATRNINLMPKGAIKGTGKPKDGAIAYYSIGLQDWRSVSTQEWVLNDTQWTWLGTHLPA